MAMTAEAKAKKAARDKAYREKKKAEKAEIRKAESGDFEAPPDPVPQAPEVKAPEAPEPEVKAPEPEAPAEAPVKRKFVHQIELRYLKSQGTAFFMGFGDDPYRGELLDVTDAGAKVRVVRGKQTQEIWWSEQSPVKPISEEEFKNFLKPVEDAKKEGIAQARTRSAANNPRPEGSGKDAFGHRLGSQAAAINTAVRDKERTLAEIVEVTKLSASRVKGHVKELVDNGFVKMENDKAVVIKK